MNRRSLLKIGAANLILSAASLPKRLLAFSAPHLRRRRRAGPLRATQVLLILSAAINSKRLRTTQAHLVVTGQDLTKRQKTTQVMLIVAAT